MSSDWKTYQDEAAAFFSSLGFDAKVNETVAGARGKHKIDVWVTGEIHGIQLKWIIECKYWKTNIPKEKVMALTSIVQDIGADRGFLLSEIGFQSGAVRASSKSNITLTSIADLKSESKESLFEFAAASLLLRMSQLKSRLFDLRSERSDYFQRLGQLSILEMALGEAQAGRFPIVYCIDENNVRHTATNKDDFIAAASSLTDQIEKYVQ